MNQSFLGDGSAYNAGKGNLNYAHPGSEGASRSQRGTKHPNETGEAFFANTRMLDRDMVEPTNAIKDYAVFHTDPPLNLGDGSSGFDRAQPRLYDVKVSHLSGLPGGSDPATMGMGDGRPHALQDLPKPKGHSGDPLSSGLFTTDHIDPRSPESLAWLGNHRRLGLGPVGPQMIAKEFNDMDKLRSTSVMEGSPSAPTDKTAWHRAGKIAALKAFGLWR